MNCNGRRSWNCLLGYSYLLYLAPMPQSRNSSGSTKGANAAVAMFAASFRVARNRSKQTFERKRRKCG